MKTYVAENKITDILFANNIFKAYSSHIYGAYLRFLNQSGHILPATLPQGGSPSHPMGTPGKKYAPLPTTPKAAGNVNGAAHHPAAANEHKNPSPAPSATTDNNIED